MDIFLQAVRSVIRNPLLNLKTRPLLSSYCPDSAMYQYIYAIRPDPFSALYYTTVHYLLPCTPTTALLLKTMLLLLYLSYFSRPFCSRWLSDSTCCACSSPSVVSSQEVYTSPGHTWSLTASLKTTVAAPSHSAPFSGFSNHSKVHKLPYARDGTTQLHCQ